MKILIVDDEMMLLSQLKRVFERQRYLVETACDGSEALSILTDLPVDLIILDIGLPGDDGFAVLSKIRGMEITTPVLMLTARGKVGDRVKGLDLGADDYLAKPFSLDELLARVRALLRRAVGQRESLLQVGDLCLDTVSREVISKAEQINLTSKEFSILELLLYNKNRVVSKFSLAEHVWGDAFDPFSMSNFIDVHIKNLRKKIAGEDNIKLIETIRGVGYIIRDQ